MEPDINQKRKIERFPVRLPAGILLAGEEKEEPMIFLTDDASAGGVFIKTERSLPLGSEVTLDLVLPCIELKNFEGQGIRLKVSGAVIRVNETGMAIRFNEDYSIWPLSSQ